MLNGSLDLSEYPGLLDMVMIVSLLAGRSHARIRAQRRAEASNKDVTLHVPKSFLPVDHRGEYTALLVSKEFVTTTRL